MQKIFFKKKTSFLGQARAHPAGPMQIKGSITLGINEFFEIVEAQNASNFQDNLIIF